MDKPENSSLLNVCIIPNEYVSETCTAISQSLKSEYTMFTLGEGLFAHMTAYMARFSDDVIDSVVDKVEKLLASASIFRCEHTGYFMTAGRYLEASYRKSDKFMELHESLINSVAGLRINPGQPYEEGYFTPYTDEQRQNAKETGYDLARNLYRPHVTLTRYSEGNAPQELPVLPTTDLSFNLSKVCIYKADDNGAIYELVQEFQVGA